MAKSLEFCIRLRDSDDMGSMNRLYPGKFVEGFTCRWLNKMGGWGHFGNDCPRRCQLVIAAASRFSKNSNLLFISFNTCNGKR